MISADPHPFERHLILIGTGCAPLEGKSGKESRRWKIRKAGERTLPVETIRKLKRCW